MIRWRWGALLVGALHCAKAPADPFTPAQAHYQALVSQGRPPRDPGFDAVLIELSKVAPGSPHYLKAQALREALESARGPRPSLPLAAPPTALNPALAQKQGECAKLARSLGSARGAERDALTHALAECGQQAEALREAQHPHSP